MEEIRGMLKNWRTALPGMAILVENWRVMELVEEDSNSSVVPETLGCWIASVICILVPNIPKEWERSELSNASREMGEDRGVWASPVNVISALEGTVKWIVAWLLETLQE